jgi:hypothetical protein
MIFGQWARGWISQTVLMYTTLNSYKGIVEVTVRVLVCVYVSCTYCFYMHNLERVTFAHICSLAGAPPLAINHTPSRPVCTLSFLASSVACACVYTLRLSRLWSLWHLCSLIHLGRLPMTGYGQLMGSHAGEDTCTRCQQTVNLSEPHVRITWTLSTHTLSLNNHTYIRPCTCT